MVAAEAFRVVGVGNRYRRDDGVGPWVVDRLQAVGVSAQEHSGEGAGLIELFEACERVVLVDAAMSGAAPGTIHRFDATTDTIPKAFFRYSSHLFGVAEAVEMARALGRLPRQLLVFGIEGADFGHGETLSPPVDAAAAAVVRTIRAEVADADAGA